MTYNDSEGFGKDIEQMLNKVEQKIRSLKALNQPELDRLDWLEIEERLKTLEKRDDNDKQQLQKRLQFLEDQILLFNRRLYVVLLVLLGVCIFSSLFVDIL